MGDPLTFMDGRVTGLLERLIGRAGGPMHFRLIMQPLMALIFGIRAGLADAKAGRPAYLWAVFTTPGHAADLLRSGWKDVGKVFLMAVLMDAIYQIIVVRWIYPVEALLVAVVLSFVPYLVIRGPVDRVMRRR